MWITTVWEI